MLIRPAREIALLAMASFALMTMVFAAAPRLLARNHGRGYRRVRNGRAPAAAGTHRSRRRGAFADAIAHLVAVPDAGARIDAVSHDGGDRRPIRGSLPGPLRNRRVAERRLDGIGRAYRNPHRRAQRDERRSARFSRRPHGNGDGRDSNSPGAARSRADAAADPSTDLWTVAGAGRNPGANRDVSADGAAADGYARADRHALADGNTVAGSSPNGRTNRRADRGADGRARTDRRTDRRTDGGADRRTDSRRLTSLVQRRRRPMAAGTVTSRCEIRRPHLPNRRSNFGRRADGDQQPGHESGRAGRA